MLRTVHTQIRVKSSPGLTERRRERLSSNHFSYPPITNRIHSLHLVPCRVVHSERLHGHKQILFAHRCDERSFPTLTYHHSDPAWSTSTFLDRHQSCQNMRPDDDRCTCLY